MDSISLAIFHGRLNAVCEEMGFALQRSALSPNIKDRMDFSCAIFDEKGHICAQAAHIPVHLGSMAYAMNDIVRKFEWSEGDMLVLNDPFLGGTHLPDVTMVAPVFFAGRMLGFVANRAHHANIGSHSPGSMPLSRSLGEEGVLIQPTKLINRGVYDEQVVRTLSEIEGEPAMAGDEANVRLPGDFYAQVSANHIGSKRLVEWLKEPGQGAETYLSALAALNEYGSSLAHNVISELPNGVGSFQDFLDDDGFSDRPIRICLNLSIEDGVIRLDFSGTDPAVAGNLNCPLSVCMASVYYVFVCLLPSYTPCCQGVFESIDVHVPEGCLLNAPPDSAVAAGNVETSMRVVDVVIGALSELGLDTPAASQGTMNNLALGARNEASLWDYYETIGGGSGAHSSGVGINSIQSHMTNTLNTPVESLEQHYPLRIETYAIRDRSGGLGAYAGGDGIVRSYRFLEPASFTLLTERRKVGPWGEKGGCSGMPGINTLNGEQLPGKYSGRASVGDLLIVHTPGGGGWGRHATREKNS